MKARIWGLAAIASIALVAGGGVGHSLAVAASGCSGNEYTAANGTTSLTSSDESRNDRIGLSGDRAVQ